MMFLKEVFMPKRPASQKKIPIELWVALIGLVGVLITALLGSPILLDLLHRASASATSPAQVQVSATQKIDTPAAVSPDCVPSNLSELPTDATAIIEPLEGSLSQAPFETLRYEYQTGLRLASGMTVDFKKMRSFELSNPGFTTDFAADIEIVFLDCTIHKDRIQSGSDSLLTAETKMGQVELHILKVKRVDFK
jgi:hypothetical protein